MNISTVELLDWLVKASYLVAATLFLLGLQRMASPMTASSGIRWAGLGMLLATVATFFLPELHNVPLISWVALGGRCASCGTPIPLRYPLVEGLTGLLSAAVAWRFGFEWAALGAMVLTWFLVALTFIDIDHQLLPDNWPIDNPNWR